MCAVQGKRERQNEQRLQLFYFFFKNDTMSRQQSMLCRDMGHHFRINLKNTPCRDEAICHVATRVKTPQQGFSP